MFVGTRRSYRAKAILLTFVMGGPTLACRAQPSVVPSVVPNSFGAVAVQDWGLRVFKGDRELSFAEMADELAQYEFVLVGENHIDDQTHRVELRVLEALAQRKPGKTTLAMEMFQRDVQGTVDAYLAGDLGEQAFLDTARPWGNYRTGYRPLVEFARTRGLPVVAANLPRDLQRKLGRGGAQAAKELSKKERAWMSAEVHPPAQSYWERVEGRLRDAGHAAMGRSGPTTPEQRKWSVQNLWDNTMAESAVLARERTPDSTVMLVAGGFHVEHGDGLGHQIKARRKQASVATVAITPLSDLRGAQDLPRSADYSIFTLADGRGPNNGTYAVNVPVELKYRVSAPSVGQDFPVFVWLGADHESTAVALRYWSLALGPKTVVVVVEPPHRVEEPDLRRAGRWTWPESEGQDYGRVVGALEDISEYVDDRWGIKEDAFVIAGSGSGATAALFCALYGDFSGATIVASAPSGTRIFAEASLPDRSGSVRGIRDTMILGDAPQGVLETLKGGDVPHSAVQTGAGLRGVEQATRTALKLADHNVQDAKLLLELPVDTAIARQWAQLYARQAERDGKGRTVVAPGTAGAERLKVEPSDFPKGRGLPLSPGAFGGTTILVLPPGTPAKLAAGWKALTDPDVLNERSRFSHLNVTTLEGLHATFDTMRSKSRATALIIPATFSASDAFMQRLQREASRDGADKGLQLSWRPGLGGDLAAELAKQDGP